MTFPASSSLTPLLLHMATEDGFGGENPNRAARVWMLHRQVVLMGGSKGRCTLVARMHRGRRGVHPVMAMVVRSSSPSWHATDGGDAVERDNGEKRWERWRQTCETHM
jgi:hypothetical protein